MCVSYMCDHGDAVMCEYVNVRMCISVCVRVNLCVAVFACVCSFMGVHLQNWHVDVSVLMIYFGVCVYDSCGVD